MPDIEYQELENPYAPPRHLGAGDARRQAIPFDPERSRGLVKTGVIAAVFLELFPPIAFFVGLSLWRKAQRDLELMEQGLMSLEDGARGKTRAGMILGKVSTIVAPFALITLVLYLWAVVESN